jgi:hypothetical protein
MSIINKPEVSKTIALAYEVLVIFIAAVTVFFLYAAFFTPLGIIGGIIASIVSASVTVIMILILASLYRTRYLLTNEELIIKTTRLIGGDKTIPLRNVKSIEKTRIPFGIRLFGASFHGGHYHIPSLGRAFLSITNFKDGLLIKTSNGNYLITPSKPLDFKEAIESRKGNLENL